MGTREKVKEFIEKEKLIRKGDRILLGLSGGADSVCLFCLLLELREELGFELRAVHVHHGIRREAEEDVAFVTALCEKENVPCYVFREDVPAYAKEKGLGEEEAGRVLRYLDFQKCLERWEEEETGSSDPEKSDADQDRWQTEDSKESDAGWDRRQMEDSKEADAEENCRSRFKIATAHHENDQAETVLFQLFRGCGLSGLRGILPKRGNIIRPILCLSREEIEAYLTGKGIGWREDATNASGDYSRNRIRHQILPVAETEVSRGAVSHIGKTAQILREAEDYIRRQTKEAYEKISLRQEGFLVFDTALLLVEDVFLQKQVILYGLGKVLPGRKDIGAVHVEDILKLAGKQGNGQVILPGGVRVQKLYQKLLIFRGSAEGKESVLSELLPEAGGFLCGEEPPLFRAEIIDLSDEAAAVRRFGIRDVSEIMGCIPEKTYTKWFDYGKIKNYPVIRSREPGDYLEINREHGHKKLKDYLIDQKIPAKDREQLLLLADGSHVIWIPGMRISEGYKVTEDTRQILKVQIYGGEEDGGEDPSNDSGGRGRCQD